MKNKEKRMFVKKSFVRDNNFSEIDFDLYDEFEFSYDTHDEFREIGDNRHGSADAYPIKIDRMIEALQKLKSEGATHVELEYHCDHIGYEISGYEIRLATDEEISDVIAKENAHREKMKKREELLRQLAELDNPPKQQLDTDLPF